MSEFSEKCKEYVLKNNTNVYQLAKQSGLERTTLQRMVTGNRLPSIQVVKDFCSNLQITTIEEEELLELYKIEKIGKETYYTRKEIQNLITGIQKLRSDWDTATDFRKEQDFTEWKKDGGNVYRLNLDLDIAEAIQYVIRKEISSHQVACIDMDIFPKCEYAMQQLIREEKAADCKIICRHYINFIRNSPNVISAIENIRMLKLVIPFAFTFHNTYQVQYSYTTGDSKDNFFQLWPHFLITSSSMILFSECESRAVLIEDLNIVQCYREEIQEMAKKYRPLFGFLNLGQNPEKALEYYYENVMDEIPGFVFEGNPCVTRMFYPELLKEELGNSYIRVMFEHYESILYENQGKQSISYFGMAGMEDFLNQGKLPGIYGRYTRNYTPVERKKMLEYFFKNLYTENWKNYLLKDEIFGIEEGINIELYEGKKIFFISTSEKFPFGIIGIEEKGICEAFRDYFESLKESENIYGEENTRQMFLKNIQEYMGK